MVTRDNGVKETLETNALPMYSCPFQEAGARDASRGVDVTAVDDGA